MECFYRYQWRKAIIWLFFGTIREHKNESTMSELVFFRKGANLWYKFWGHGRVNAHDSRTELLLYPSCSCRCSIDTEFPNTACMCLQMSLFSSLSGRELLMWTQLLDCKCAAFAAYGSVVLLQHSCKGSTVKKQRAVRCLISWYGMRLLETDFMLAPCSENAVYCLTHLFYIREAHADQLSGRGGGGCRGQRQGRVVDGGSEGAEICLAE